MEGRVSTFGITIMISGSIPHNSTWEPVGVWVNPQTLKQQRFLCGLRVVAALQGGNWHVGCNRGSEVPLEPFPRP